MMNGLLIATILLLLGVVITAIWKMNLGSLMRRELIMPARIIGTTFVLLVAAYLFLNLKNIQAENWVLISLYVGLVGVTVLYVLSTHRQADASIQMAEEMREQRIITSRPIVILRAASAEVISTELASDYFEIYNAGNGTAIEVEVSLCLERKPPYNPHNAKREGFLLAKDTPIEFRPTFPAEVTNSTFYIVAEYQGIPSHSPQPIWYQTWLPCKLSVSGKVISSKLEFCDDVSEDKRIGIFRSEFNNGRRQNDSRNP